jgi:hypothetical protein
MRRRSRLGCNAGARRGSAGVRVSNAERSLPCRITLRRQASFAYRVDADLLVPLLDFPLRPEAGPFRRHGGRRGYQGLLGRPGARSLACGSRDLDSSLAPWAPTPPPPGGSWCSGNSASPPGRRRCAKGRHAIGYDDVTFGEVYAAFPFQNVLTTTTLSGAQVKQVLEQGASGQFGMVQVSGLSFTNDPSLPVGRCVTSITVKATG